MSQDHFSKSFPQYPEISVTSHYYMTVPGTRLASQVHVRAEIQHFTTCGETQRFHCAKQASSLAASLENSYESVVMIRKRHQHNTLLTNLHFYSVQEPEKYNMTLNSKFSFFQISLSFAFFGVVFLEKHDCDSHDCDLSLLSWQ